MPYMIRKKVNDARQITCGLRMPDGFYQVMEMNYGSVKQLDNLKAYGYSVTETDKPVGAYTEDGDRPVDTDSLYHWIYKEGPLRFLDEKPAEVPEVAKTHDQSVHAAMEASELDKIRDVLTERGVKFRTDAKLPTLKKKLAESDHAVG